MCGILGIWAKNKKGEAHFSALPKALSKIQHRGPDNQTSKIYSNCALAHARLSIIDLNAESNQPFEDESGNYSLTFNGEIYNYLEIRKNLENSGIKFRTNSDTEVLLQLLKQKGEKGIQELNGFFSFVFHDVKNNSLLAARDRFGIKPLLYYQDEDVVIFSSELNAIGEFNINKSIDKIALNEYFSFTYIPASRTVFSEVKKLMPGQLLKANSNGVELYQYYQNSEKLKFEGTYSDAKNELQVKLNQSVSRRLIADVEVGSFLSGGLDSSVIAMLAKAQKNDLRTFSIGFDHEFFNESNYAEQMAKHIGSKHEKILLGKQEFKNSLNVFLDSLDEPFADSSAFAVFLLSKRTKQHVSVSLSGDGADELFGGYQKHLAELRIREASGIKQNQIKFASKLLSPIKSSRANKLGNFNRKLQKFSKGFSLSKVDRYIQWCQWIPDEDRTKLLKEVHQIKSALYVKNELISMNDYLLADQNFVLPNDMLKKVDAMSMAHALEVRVPFLDHELVEFVNSLHPDFKIKDKITKRILRDTFAKELPKEIIDRSKRGFEIPLEHWLKDEIDLILNSETFSSNFIQQQGLFDFNFIKEIIWDWNKGRIGERIYLVWALIVFQNWFTKNSNHD